MSSKQTMKNQLTEMLKDFAPKPYTLEGFIFRTISSPLDVTDPLLHQELMECASPLFDDLLEEHIAFHKDSPEAKEKVGEFLSTEWNAYLHYLNIFTTIDNGDRPAYFRDDTCTSQHDYLNGTLSMPQVDREELFSLPPDSLPTIDD